MVDYQIPITYVVNASTVTPQAGLEPLKLSTILILSSDSPVQALTGSYIIARNASSVGQAFGTTTTTYKMANAIFAQNPNILANDGYVIVAPYADSSETTATAIARIATEIYFEGILTTKALGDSEAIAASNAVQAMGNRIFFLESSLNSSIQSSGLFTQLTSNYYTKCLLYTKGADSSASALNAKLFAAAYASRGLAVNYSGSNTTLTMNLKDLAGISADTNISETILASCETYGVDCFPSIEGLAKVVSNPVGGHYFDQVANRIWLVNTIQRNAFNALAQTGTKIPQTEPGVAILTNACREVCASGVRNGMIAPGTWNGSDTFGVLEDFHRNIEEFGYYIYHLPVAQQSQADRTARKCPLIQVAVKEAGAIHSANILIYIEA